MPLSYMQREFIELIAAVKKFYNKVHTSLNYYYRKQSNLAMPLCYTRKEFIEFITAVKKFYGTAIVIHSNYYWKQKFLWLSKNYLKLLS
jgi:hypothetical protein